MPKPGCLVHFVSALTANVTLLSSAVLLSLLEFRQEKRGTRFWWPAAPIPLSACAFFFLAGLAFIPRLGVEDDEALFAWPWYRPRGQFWALYIGHTRLPIMLISYLGALKSWIYRPIFRLFGTGVDVLRLPMLFAGAVTVWLFYCLLRRVAGERAAWIGCGLLATDAIYLLSSIFDWGPVVLQHLLIVGGTLLLVRFWQERRDALLGWGFALLGLAAWDKALAFWSLGGFGVATLITLRSQIRELWTARRLRLALAGFALGALPLIVYNVDSGLGSFRGNAVYDSSLLPKKLYVLKMTFDGSGLFGWLVAEDRDTPSPHTPRGGLEISSAKVASWAGNPHRDFLLYAFAAALLLAPLARGPDRRAIGFALIAMAVAWCQMAFTAGTGGAQHHTILLWPLPQMVIAVSFAAASRRLGRAGVPVLATVTLVVIGSGLAVINQYYTEAVRNGGDRNWTDALYRLSDYLKATPAPYMACVDWGILDSLRLLGSGKLPLLNWELGGAEPSSEDRQIMARLIADPRNLFLGHTSSAEVNRGTETWILHFAEAASYRREMLTVISDSYGRPSLEVYRFVR